MLKVLECSFINAVELVIRVLIWTVWFPLLAGIKAFKEIELAWSSMAALAWFT
jgi:hypothetical protein